MKQLLDELHNNLLNAGFSCAEERDFPQSVGESNGRLSLSSKRVWVYRVERESRAEILRLRDAVRGIVKLYAARAAERKLKVPVPSVTTDANFSRFVEVYVALPQEIRELDGG